MFTDPIRYREKTITVVGAPFALGQSRPGVDQGPDYLRRAGFIKELKEQGWHVEDSGDVSMQSAKYVRTEAGDKTIQYGGGETNGSAPNGKSWKEHRAEAVSQACRLLSIAVNKPAREGKFTLTVDGDHSIAIGSISGILRAQPETRVIWVDQPLLGWRQVNVTAQRTKQDFAQQMKRLVEVYFPQAELIRLVVEISTPIRRRRCTRRLRPPRLAESRASWSFTTRPNMAVGSIGPNANSRFLRHSVWIAGSQMPRP